MTDVKFTNVRLSFTFVHRPQSGAKNTDGSQSEAQFSTDVLVPKTDAAQTAAAKAALHAAAVAKWGADKAGIIVPRLAAENRIQWKDGDLKLINDAPAEAYKGHWYFRAANPIKPRLVDANRIELLESSGKPYSGCYANVIVAPRATEHPTGGKRLSWRLLGIQFVRDGEPLGGARIASADAFDTLAEELNGPAAGGSELF